MGAKYSIFFQLTIHRIFLKFVRCFIDINQNYKSYLTTFLNPSLFLLSLSKLTVLKKIV